MHRLQREEVRALAELQRHAGRGCYGIMCTGYGTLLHWTSCIDRGKTENNGGYAGLSTGNAAIYGCNSGIYRGNVAIYGGFIAIYGCITII
eukprot:1369717-Rhodomonas_salina.1